MAPGMDLDQRGTVASSVTRNSGAGLPLTRDKPRTYIDVALSDLFFYNDPDTLDHCECL
jgi:hypothetical protein